MVWSVRATGSRGAGNGTTVTSTFSTKAVANDFIVGAMRCRSSANSLGVPSGYTALNNLHAYQQIVGKYAAGGETGFTATNQGATLAESLVLTWSGGPPPPISNIVIANGATYASAVGVNVPYNGVTVSQNKCVAVFLGCSVSTFTSANTPADFPNVVDKTSDGTVISSLFAYNIQSGAQNIPNGSWNLTGGSSQPAAGIVVVLAPGTTTGPQITNVNTTNSITSTQTNVAVNGTNFGTTPGAVKLFGGTGNSIESDQTIVSWSDSQIIFNVSLGSLPYGTLLLAVDNAADQQGTINVTMTTPSGLQVVTFGTLLGAITDANFFDPNNLPKRLYDTPTDIAAGFQGEVPSNVEVDTNGRLAWQSSVTDMPWRYWNGSTWSTKWDWNLRGLPPKFTGPNVTDFTFQQGSNPPSFNYGALFSLPATGTFSVFAGALPNGWVVDPVTGIASGSPTTVQAASSVVIGYTDLYGTTAQTNPHNYTVDPSPNNVTFSGPIPDVPASQTSPGSPISPINTGQYFTFATSFTVTGLQDSGLSMDPLTGIITGAPNAGTYSVQVTGSNSVPSFASSNTFVITVSANQTQATVPDVQSGHLQMQLAIVACIDSGLQPVVVFATNPGVAIGCVISQSLTPFSVWPLGTVIVLTVSEYPPNEEPAVLAGGFETLSGGIRS